MRDIRRKAKKGGGVAIAVGIKVGAVGSYFILFLISYQTFAGTITWFLMNVLAFVIVPRLTYIYDRLEQDWFLIEEMKREKQRPWITIMLRWLSSLPPLILIPPMTVYYNPFLVTIMRRPHGAKGLSLKDWRNMTISILTLNSGLTYLCSIGVNIRPKTLIWICHQVAGFAYDFVIKMTN